MRIGKNKGEIATGLPPRHRVFVSTASGTPMSLQFVPRRIEHSAFGFFAMTSAPMRWLVAILISMSLVVGLPISTHSTKNFLSGAVASRPV
jgi:hypothetical protein